MSEPFAANWLARRPCWGVAGAAATIAFATCTRMDVLRRPFTAPTCDSLPVAGANPQSFPARFEGYVAASFTGIRVVSEKSLLPGMIRGLVFLRRGIAGSRPESPAPQ